MFNKGMLPTKELSFGKLFQLIFRIEMEWSSFRWSKTDFLKSVSDKNFKDPESQ